MKHLNRRLHSTCYHLHIPARVKVGNGMLANSCISHVNVHINPLPSSFYWYIIIYFYKQVFQGHEWMLPHFHFQRIASLERATRGFFSLTTSTGQNSVWTILADLQGNRVTTFFSESPKLSLVVPSLGLKDTMAIYVNRVFFTLIILEVLEKIPFC